MQLNPIMDSFYKSILDYSGMTIEDDIFVNKPMTFGGGTLNLGDIRIDGKALALPYFDILKNPEGKLIFHPLNENYTSPENTIFNLYKKRLTTEINLKLAMLIISLVTLASDPLMQQRIKSSKMIALVSSLGELDIALIEELNAIIKASKKANDASFIIGLYVKKNGEVKDVPYAAIGKVNFVLYNEIVKALEDKGREYRVFGRKTAKKHLLALETIFNVIFPSIDNKGTYMEGTDNKVFRYLNILLKTSYLVTHRVNELANMLAELNEPLLQADNIRFNLDWTNDLEKLYDMANEIRLIPSQLDITVEASRLKVDESKVKAEPTPTPQVQQAPQFNPTLTQPQTPIPTPMQATPQTQQPRQLTPEEIIRGGIQPAMNQPVMQPMMDMQQQMAQPTYTPSWVQMEQFKQQQQQFGTQQPMVQPQMMPQMQPQMMPQMQPQMMPQMQPQMMPQMQPQMMQQLMQQNPQLAMQLMQQMQMPQQQPMMPMQQQPGLQVNPMFLSNQQVRAPWN